jgi:hypothetical protein
LFNQLRNYYLLKKDSAPELARQLVKRDDSNENEQDITGTNASRRYAPVGIAVPTFADKGPQGTS